MGLGGWLIDALSGKKTEVSTLTDRTQAEIGADIRGNYDAAKRAGGNPLANLARKGLGMDGYTPLTAMDQPVSLRGLADKAVTAAPMALGLSALGSKATAVGGAVLGLLGGQAHAEPTRPSETPTVRAVPAAVSAPVIPTTLVAAASSSAIQPGGTEGSKPLESASTAEVGRESVAGLPSKAFAEAAQPSIAERALPTLVRDKDSPDVTAYNADGSVGKGGRFSDETYKKAQAFIPNPSP